MSADDLAKLLDELGKRLGPTGSHVFELAVRQVYINGITAAVLLAVVVAAGVVAGPRLFRWTQGGGSYSDRDMVGILVGIGYIVAAVVAVVNALYLIPAMLNPEYAAIRDLLRAVSR